LGKVGRLLMGKKGV